MQAQHEPSTVFLLVNIADLAEAGITFTVCPDKGDRSLPGAYTVKPIEAMRPDDVYLAVECPPGRAKAVKGGLSLMGLGRLGRKIRSHITRQPPRSITRPSGNGGAPAPAAATVSAGQLIQ